MKTIQKLAMGLMALCCATWVFTSCSSDDDGIVLNDKYLTIEGATYESSAIPAATTAETLTGVQMSGQVMNGAMDYITVTTEQEVETFYIAIEGVPGHLAYTPATGSQVRATGYNVYVIPLLFSQEYRGDCTLILSGKLFSGDITTPVRHNIKQVATQEGALEIKLSFSNAKDVDLHVYTPSEYEDYGFLASHIYYGNRGGNYWWEEKDSLLSYGLDIDSNAGCRIDDVNKENIYIPKELVQNGTYRVVVNMYSNCDAEVATNYSVVVRYKGKIIATETGENPAQGVYPVGAGNHDYTEVMTFTITDARPIVTNNQDYYDVRFTPTALSDMDEMKLLDEKAMKE